MKKDSIFSKSETAIFIPKSITKQFPIKQKSRLLLMGVKNKRLNLGVP